jgi:hypothetical protein
MARRYQIVKADNPMENPDIHLSHNREQSENNHFGIVFHHFATTLNFCVNPLKMLQKFIETCSQIHPKYRIPMTNSPRHTSVSIATVLGKSH